MRRNPHLILAAAPSSTSANLLRHWSSCSRSAFVELPSSSTRLMPCLSLNCAIHRAAVSSVQPNIKPYDRPRHTAKVNLERVPLHRPIFDGVPGDTRVSGTQGGMEAYVEQNIGDPMTCLRETGGGGTLRRCDTIMQVLTSTKH